MKVALNRRLVLAGGSVLVATRGARAQARKTLIVGGFPAASINPALGAGTTTGIPGTQVFAGLLELDSRQVPRPYVARSWEISADGLSYTFHLRDGILFHDGKPLTAADVAFSVGAVRANHPFGRSMFGAVDRVETPDPLTARIVLKHPHPALLPALTTLLMPILPRHVYGQGELRTNPANQMLVGAGPFRLTEFKAGETITLARNPGFFLPGRPKSERIIIRLFSNMQAARLAIESGEVDVMLTAPFSTSDFESLRKNPKLAVHEGLGGGLGSVNYVEFNLRKPPFDDVRVRKAVAHAIDRKFIVEKLNNGVTLPLQGPLPADNRFAATDIVTYDFDLRRAADILDQAGYKPDAGGIRLKATLDIPPFLPDVLGRVGDWLKPQLKRIGIEVERRVAPDIPTYMRRVANWEHEFAMAQIFNYMDPVIGTERLFLGSNQVKGVMYTNTSGYSNPKVDGLLATAGQEMDFAKRQALYGAFQRIVTDELPYLYITSQVSRGVTQKGVTGVPDTCLAGMAPMWDIEAG